MSTTTVRRDARALIIMLVSLVVYTAADLATKEWALNTLSHERRGPATSVCQPDDQGYVHMQRIPSAHLTLIDGYLEFRYAENCGAAFGILRTAPSWVRAAIFGVAALGAFIVLTTMFVRGAGGSLFGYAVPLILSGALGNLADRVRHGFVVDFIRFHWQTSWDYPTFNVADCTITIGVVLLLLDGMRKAESAVAPVENSASS